MILNKNYTVSDGPNGMAEIRVTGRCTSDEVTTIEGQVVGRYELCPLPAARGHVLKALDGSSPVLFAVQPATMSRVYTCCKVGGRCTPFAPLQDAGAAVGYTVLQFEEIYIEVSNVAS